MSRVDSSQIVCDYCGKNITRHISSKYIGRNFCNKKCRAGFSRRKQANFGVEFENRIQCEMCGFRPGDGEYEVGDICPKCSLSNLVSREEAVKIYERTDR